jgi:hypothetical protein
MERTTQRADALFAGGWTNWLRSFVVATSVVTWLIAGCSRPPTAEAPAERRAEANPAVTRPALKPVEMRYGIYLARREVRTTITSDGLLRSASTSNKSYGSGDIGRGNERVEIRQGRLTPEQITELSGLFAGWETLSSEPYGGAADGGETTIRYGNKTVSGGTDVPPLVTKVRERISAIAQTMPLVPQ